MKRSNMVSKTLYFIPALQETTRRLGYQSIIKAARQKGYRVVSVNLDWSQPLMSKFIEQATDIILKDYKDNPSVEISLLGFSFGAYISVILAHRLNLPVKKLYLCSLSPYFRDDIKDLPTDITNSLGKERMQDFSQYEFPQNLTTKTFIFLGEKEWPLIKNRAQKTLKAVGNLGHLYVIPGAIHDINSSNYAKIVESKIYRPALIGAGLLGE